MYPFCLRCISKLPPWQSLSAFLPPYLWGCSTCLRSTSSSSTQSRTSPKENAASRWAELQISHPELLLNYRQENSYAENRSESKSNWIAQIVNITGILLFARIIRKKQCAKWRTQSCKKWYEAVWNDELASLFKQVLGLHLWVHRTTHWGFSEVRETDMRQQKKKITWPVLEILGLKLQCSTKVFTPL